MRIDSRRSRVSGPKRVSGCCVYVSMLDVGAAIRIFFSSLRDPAAARAFIFFLEKFSRRIRDAGIEEKLSFESRECIV